MARSRKKGPLTAARRNRLAGKSFAIPKTRSYPIPDLRHARNALARVAQHGSPAQKAQVRRAVHRKFPSIEVSGLRPKRRK